MSGMLGVTVHAPTTTTTCMYYIQYCAICTLRMYVVCVEINLSIIQSINHTCTSHITRSLLHICPYH